MQSKLQNLSILGILLWKVGLLLDQIDWETEADHDRWWAENRGSPEVRDWFSRWHAVVERGHREDRFGWLGAREMLVGRHGRRG